MHETGWRTSNPSSAMEILIPLRSDFFSHLPFLELTYHQTTIRVLGGLLSAYHFSDDDPIFLERAQDLADRLLPAFDTPSGLPKSMVNLKMRTGVNEAGYASLVSTAEASTLQLELRYLSFLTDNDEYWHKAEKVKFMRFDLLSTFDVSV